MRWLTLKFLLIFLSIRDVGADDTTKPKFPIDRETTCVTGPIRKDGSVDFVTALNEKLRGKITPEQNANVLLIQAIGPVPIGEARLVPAYFQWLQIPVLPDQGPYFTELLRFARPTTKLNADASQALLDSHSETLIRTPWKAADYPLIAAWLKANEQSLALVVAATRRPHYYNPLLSHDRFGEEPTLLTMGCPTVHATRWFARALVNRALLHAGEGRFDDCWNDLLTVHRLARLIARGGSRIELLSGIAIERIAEAADQIFLEQAPLNPKKLRARRQEFQSLGDLPDFADKVDLFERLLWLDVLQHARLGRWKELRAFTGHGLPFFEETETIGLTDADWALVFRQANRWHDRLVLTFRLPDRGFRNQAYRQLSQDLAERTKLPGRTQADRLGDVVSKHHLPGLHTVQQWSDRPIQVRRNLLTAFALAIFCREQRRIPQQWEDLIPQYLASVPLDLFSGQPLIYRPQADGFQFYSIGENGRDEGGKGPEGNPRSDDVRVRLSFPDRQTPPKK